jgi:ornithine cyclodeaminase/alanine dehydrogenase-like protein (mu-crystallin family)
LLSFVRLAWFELVLILHRVGELIMGESPKKQKLEKWLQTGNVIYKSVGLGLMDLSVGMYVIEFAKGKEVGTQVEGF